jgi:hypothetical protein
MVVSCIQHVVGLPIGQQDGFAFFGAASPANRTAWLDDRMPVEGEIFVEDFLASQFGLGPFVDGVVVRNVVDVDLALTVDVERGLAAGFALLCASVVGDALLFDAAFVELGIFVKEIHYSCQFSSVSCFLRVNFYTSYTTKSTEKV